MKKIILMATMFCFAMAAFSENAVEIVEKSNNLPSSQKGYYTAKLTLVDEKKGSTKVQEISCYTMQEDGIEKSRMTFLSPEDVKGLTYLAVGSETWILVPPMKKARKVKKSDLNKGDGFLGTDFIYEDMEIRGTEKDDFTLLGEESVNGIICWKIEAKAKNANDKLPHRILYISKENYLCYKTEFFDKSGSLQRVMDIQEIRKIGKFLVPIKIFIRNVKTKHSTLIEMDNIDYDLEIDGEMFTVKSLENKN